MKLRTFDVAPNLPTDLEPLKELASNMWYSWNYPAIELFRQLDPESWDRVVHGPTEMLDVVPQHRFNQVLQDDSFLAYMHSVHKNFKEYFNEDTWFASFFSDLNNSLKNTKNCIAYFSMEYGIDVSIPIYSGGLGILAGDHLKAASDLGIPLVAVGLLYQRGYFKQYLSSDGWQKESYPSNRFDHMPITLQVDKSKKPILVEVEMKSHIVYARIWKCDVGRVPLLLLDTNTPENSPEDREITAQLYGGDNDMRIRQEVLIGVGGITALNLMGYHPIVCHMNEGHSAFLSLARIQYYMKNFKLSKKEASVLVKSTNIFTTHTPVPAGNDRFEPQAVFDYLKILLNDIGISQKDFFELGRENPTNETELFCMTVLALKMAFFANGVSELHGDVSRKMWLNVWPQVNASEIPIQHITNGIHTRTWISHDLGALYDLYLGPKWGKDQFLAEEIWKRVDRIPDIELWGTHERRRERLVSYARKKLSEQVKRRGAPLPEVRNASEVLNPKVLTIGFAKRFATYKRANLIFRDLDRLKKILLNPEQPVQLIFAGKAHPHDNPGKKFIQIITDFARQEDLRNNIVFIEDYDMSVGRYLVQGCDIWLNNPRRPLEASGTSGMKAAANGILNLSVLDGWWCEAYNTENGWNIGSGEEYDDCDLQDDIESNNLYDLLEKEIVPLFYHRGNDGLPREWISKMKNCVKTIAPIFSTGRMVADYTKMFYCSALENSKKLLDKNNDALKNIVHWKDKIHNSWGKIDIEKINTNIVGELKVGEEIIVSSLINLDKLEASDVKVQLYYGKLNSEGNLDRFETIEMTQSHAESTTSDKHTNELLYTGKISCKHSGVYGYTVRVLPHNTLLQFPLETGLITWSK